jgi:hypothetical protein
MVDALPVVVVSSLIKVATRAAAIAVPKRKAVSKDASKHGQPPGHLCQINYL